MSNCPVGHFINLKYACIKLECIIIECMKRVRINIILNHEILGMIISVEFREGGRPPPPRNA